MRVAGHGSTPYSVLHSCSVPLCTTAHNGCSPQVDSSKLHPVTRIIRYT
ncbi:hypothetical protein BPSOL_1647 [Bifidobacterium pseudolongum]|nr:hypothetical protein BPSOL_1647 [Bifidobacterium pseudolongum]